jgi:glycosyltransferase involved in cell wall biosynthesis
MIELAVIMSVYHNDRLVYLEESIKSILNQTYSQFDFFIAFDGPVSSEIEKYVASLNDKRIKLFRIEHNGGLARALNFLLEKVMKNPEYKLIARMDADDISMPDRFEKQHKFLSSNPEISCVGCWYQEINESGQHLYDRKLPVNHTSLKKRYFTRTPFAHPSVMYYRILIEKAGTYPTDTVLMEDNLLWGRALNKGLRFANIPEYLLKFRKDEKYFIRRSGIKYGWGFINTRFRINKTLNFPAYSYLLILLIGIIKMMPPFLLKYIYIATRKC